MENTRVNILNCPIDNISMIETLSIIRSSILEKRSIKHVVVNAAKLVYMQKDKELYNAVVSSDIINVDGQSIVWASKFLGTPLRERVAGIDLMQNLVEMAFNEKFKIYFLGAEDEIVKKVVGHYSNKYSPSVIAGYQHGYFNSEEEENIASKINTSKAEILFLAITSPKKEIFLEKYKNTINVPFIMGVGGSFDVIAGKTKRAPKWMQKYGLEWFYRVIQEPGRMWKRYLITNTLFIYKIIQQKVLAIGN